MTERDFFAHLEYRLSRELRALRIGEAPDLACSGVSPRSFEWADAMPVFHGVVWMNGLPDRHPTNYEEEWRFTLRIHRAVSARADIEWKPLLPDDERHGWLGVDTEAQRVQIDLPAGWRTAAS
ncbi:MAG: hypothetical protein KDA27_15875 [Candidatus Eisenbacteria bacterium]|uniref:Uncharacterized protein n=1 Tax=Eiseniibacteriota bacterium TaxID=2212470 RepID=A0A956SGD4_UNCEI|nr:hypothetical protein [Candidatus Eisenbacteria bacterium]MCB9465629.1 hypothetical protein [Candidatus Eisenbacteria bacterium]